MRRPKKEIQLTSYDELLGLEESPEKSMNQVMEIELEKLYPFKNHPFHVNDDEKMAETVESIKTYGVLTPALVRPRPDGGYEMISGIEEKEAVNCVERLHCQLLSEIIRMMKRSLLWSIPTFSVKIYCQVRKLMPIR